MYFCNSVLHNLTYLRFIFLKFSPADAKNNSTSRVNCNVDARSIPFLFMHHISRVQMCVLWVQGTFQDRIVFSSTRNTLSTTFSLAERGDADGNFIIEFVFPIKQTTAVIYYRLLLNLSGFYRDHAFMSNFRDFPHAPLLKFLMPINLFAASSAE